MPTLRRRHFGLAAGTALVIAFGSAVAQTTVPEPGAARAPADGPAVVNSPLPMEKRSAKRGQDVFRYETFGNEGFWTDAARLPQGMQAAEVTVLDALQLGMTIDVDQINPSLRKQLAAEFKTDLSATNAPMINDPAVMMKLVRSNAVETVGQEQFLRQRLG